MASGRVRSGRATVAGRRASAGVVVGVLVSVLGLGGCSGGSVESLDNTVATEAPRAAPVSEAPQVSGTAAATTTEPPPSKPPVAVAPSSSAVPRELPSVEDLEAVSRAALAAHDEYYRQVRGGFIDRARLLEVMMPVYADVVVADLRSMRVEQRRYVSGSVDERKVMRISPTPDRSVLHVLMCARSNDAEYDTKGTETLDDDVLVQDRLGVNGFRFQMRRVDGGWKQEDAWVETGLCAAP